MSTTCHLFFGLWTMYLESIVQRCGHGVPSIYPMDEELIKLCMVDRLERLGLAEHFFEGIEDVLAHVYRNFINEEPQAMAEYVVPLQIYKDSLAFRLLRLHGYHVSPRRFCWFLSRKDILLHMDENYEYFFSAMFNVYRAADFIFSGENDLEDARLFAKKILKKQTSRQNTKDGVVMQSNLQSEVKHEISLAWLARLDHLEHRMCIEGSKSSDLWMGKASFYRLSCLNIMLLQLATENYTTRQSIYRNELDELRRWSKDSGLCDMGFAREKTTYCYFAMAATISLSYLSDVRMVAAKSGIIVIIVTVADDFFDIGGSLDELKILMEAVRRWEGKGLLDTDGAEVEYAPTIDEYLQDAMTSVAVQNIALPTSCLVSPPLPKHIMGCPQNEMVTNLLMVSTRLLNDVQSYQREQEEGKLNIVLLYMKENPDLDIEDSITRTRRTLDEKKKELLKHILVDGISDMPKACKQVHLAL
ncbi:hypothetical protein HHK36_005399 [Tetracentron sinense]|uniref:Uncharacterized protein n=1 Tax=Tetracentron sinense TaxID=13715 RepID=A0A834ZKY4_TETSI|nr:hypothetical protein HHK36_005399 [Tetracentron sinense]